MYRNPDGSMKETVRFLVKALVLFLALDVMLCVAVLGADRIGDWNHERVSYASCAYVDPDELDPKLPGWLAGIAELLRWDDGEEDGYYLLTDSEGQQFIIYPDEMDAQAFCGTVSEGERLSVWWAEWKGEKQIRAIDGYYGYEEAVAEWKSSARFMTAVLVISFGVTALAGYCLVRLKREGEAFRQKLPKWIREGT